MKNSRIKVQVLGVAGLLMLGASAAQADMITQIFSLVGNDGVGWGTIAASPNVNTFPNTVANGSSVTAAHDTISVAFSAAPGHPGAVFITGTTWEQQGWPIISTYILGTHFGGGDTLTLSFAPAISAFGISLQDGNDSVPFSGSISVTCSVVCTGSTGPFTVAATPTGSPAVYDPVFLGVSDSGASIQSVTVSMIGSADGSYFGVGPTVLSDTGKVPEPWSVVLLASCLAALPWKMLQRRRSRA